MYTEFLNKEYINKEHSAIKQTPRERFMQDFSNIKRITDDDIEECFLHRETRNVRNDATISFRNFLYEVPQEFIKKAIVIKFKPTQIDELCNTQKDLIQILGPLLTQFELNLARIYVLNPKTKEDAFNKSILWIKEHLEFMELVYGHIKAQENALIKNILPLEEKLKERKLDKWMERVRR